jgi:hypothetical protein
MVEPSLEDVFPGLQGQPYQIASPRDPRYNCIAFAVGDNRNWWWPDLTEEDTWPAGVARVATVEAFRDAFATLGYMVCDHAQLEPGFEKMVGRLGQELKAPIRSSALLSSRFLR